MTIEIPMADNNTTPGTDLGELNAGKYSIEDLIGSLDPNTLIMVTIDDPARGIVSHGFTPAELADRLR